jgi:hypothetical protein
MPEYTHTFIPDRADFAPDPKQVGSFLASLMTLGAAPLNPTVTTSKLSGEVRTFKNPFTGKTDSFAMRKTETLKNVAAVPGALKGLDDYNVTVAGKGPPKLRAFVFDFKGKYDFLVHCCLRSEVVSTSNWHDEVPIKRNVKSFGEPCSSTERLGIFHNPNTLEIIEVPKAGCARFWIEFDYGKMLFPAIVDRLDLIEPKIVAAAEKEFTVEFVQGCRWCA